MRKTDPNKRTQDLLKQVGSRFYLCTVGGGQDGAVLATAFVNAEFPEGVNGLVVTGPHMPNEDIKSLLQIVDVNPHLKLVKFLSEPLHIYSAAERIVSMGGYNTTLELVGLGANALLVPRVQPREEQWIRSQALQSLGLLDHLHPQQLTPAYLSHWFKTPFKRAAAREVIDMEGYFRIPELLRRLLKHNQESQKKFPAPIHHALT